MNGRISKLESFGLVDGPGVRFVVFMQGCHMRCLYCHNPETWDLNGGEEISSETLFNNVISYKNYWADNGGVTFSGGEPLVQIDFLLEMCKKLKKEGVHIAIDTAGNPYQSKGIIKEKIDELLNYVDLFLLDIKEIDPVKHKSLTGQDNTNILEFAKYLNDHHKKMWIRYVLVPGITDSEEDLRKTREFIDTLEYIERVEVLPYHRLAITKYETLNIPYKIKDIPTPTQEQKELAKQILEFNKLN